MSVVFPSPASPVTKRSWRTPVSAVARPRCSASHARARPASGNGGKGTDVRGAERRTVRRLPMKRYPRRCAVSMKRGVLTTSPRAWRSSRIQTESTTSLAVASGLRPEGLQQRCFGQQLSRVFHQIAAEGEGLGPEGERLVAAPQGFVRKVEPQRQGREGSGGICISQRTTLEQKLKRN